jgi:hypothetical protein
MPEVSNLNLTCKLQGLDRKLEESQSQGEPLGRTTFYLSSYAFSDSLGAAY